MGQNHNFNHLGDNLAVRYLKCSELKPYKNNPRKHSKYQIRQLARSIEEFGFTNPVLIDAEEGIIAGHGRVEAALSLGMEKVPVIYLGHLTEVQKRAYKQKHQYHHLSSPILQPAVFHFLPLSISF